MNKNQEDRIISLRSETTLSLTYAKCKVDTLRDMLNKIGAMTVEGTQPSVTQENMLDVMDDLSHALGWLESLQGSLDSMYWTVYEFNEMSSECPGHIPHPPY